MSQTVDNRSVLITGANRGIGRGLVEHYIAQPKTTVIAAVRDAKSMPSIQTPKGNYLHVLSLDSAAAEGPGSAGGAIKSLQEGQQSISKIDTVIACAGVSHSYAPVSEIQVSDLQNHIDVNVFGPLRLFQATAPLLKRSQDPKFVVLSSLAGSIGAMEGFPFPAGSYGASKAMINYLTRKIHFENQELTAFSISPGWVQTDMGFAGAEAFGWGKPQTTLEESVAGLTSEIDKSTRETHGGTFKAFDNSERPW